MRFGAIGNLYRYKEIAAFRNARAVSNLMRALKRLNSLRFTKDFGNITFEFKRAA